VLFNLWNRSALQIHDDTISIKKNMIKFLIPSFLFLLLMQSFSPTISTDEIRRDYPKAMVDKTICEKWYQQLQIESFENNPVLLAYKGGIYMGMAKFAIVAKKMTYVNKGRDLIETAVAKDKMNVEIRFIRYAVQCKLPIALGYNKNKTEDKAFISSNLSQIKNEQFKNEILKYLQENI
jgi:hypothetical protein